MDNIESVIEGFGRSIGIDRLCFNRHRVVRLDIEALGSLFFELVEGRQVLVYLAGGLERITPAVVETALKLCHFLQAAPFTVISGIKAPDRIVFGVRLAAGQVTLAGIDEILELLREYAGAVRQV